MSRIAPFVALALVLAAGAALGLDVRSVTLESSYDGRTTHSVVVVPDGYDDHTPAPLLVALHGMGHRGAWMAALYGQETNRRGWLLACPDARGERVGPDHHMGARAAQWDVMDLVSWMGDEYSVEPSRVYLLGRSMGGLHAALTAEKNPTVFAAVADWFGISDIGELFDYCGTADCDSVHAEMGGRSWESPWEYARRSPMAMAVNLRRQPFALYHGTEDELVSPDQAARLDEAIRAARPLHYAGLEYYEGGHGQTPAQIVECLDWMGSHELEPDPPAAIELRVDEDRTYGWIGVERRDTERFGEVAVRRVDGTHVRGAFRNVAELELLAREAGLDRDQPLLLEMDMGPTGGARLLVTGLDPHGTHGAWRPGTGEPITGVEAGPGWVSIPMGPGLSRALVSSAWPRHR